MDESTRRVGLLREDLQQPARYQVKERLADAGQGPEEVLAGPGRLQQSAAERAGNAGALLLSGPERGRDRLGLLLFPARGRITLQIEGGDDTEMLLRQLAAKDAVSLQAIGADAVMSPMASAARSNNQA